MGVGQLHLSSETLLNLVSLSPPPFVFPESCLSVHRQVRGCTLHVTSSLGAFFFLPVRAPRQTFPALGRALLLVSAFPFSEDSLFGPYCTSFAPRRVPGKGSEAADRSWRVSRRFPSVVLLSCSASSSSSWADRTWGGQIKHQSLLEVPLQLAALWGQQLSAPQQTCPPDGRGGAAQGSTGEGGEQRSCPR